VAEGNNRNVSQFFFSKLTHCSSWVGFVVVVVEREGGSVGAHDGRSDGSSQLNIVLQGADLFQTVSLELACASVEGWLALYSLPCPTNLQYLLEFMFT
jgi:hypothetical protein